MSAGRQRLQLTRHVLTDDPPQLGRPAEALGGVEEVERAPQRRLLRPQQRLVGEDAAPRPRNDGLRRDPELLDPRGEPRFEARPIPNLLPVELAHQGRLASDARQLVDADGPPHCVHHRVGGDRLDQIAKRAVLDGRQRALQRRAAGHEDHRHVEVGLADGTQQRQAVHVGHGDVADDDVELPPFGQRGRLAPVVRDGHLVAARRQGAGVTPRRDWLVVDDQHLRRDHSYVRGGPVAVRLGHGHFALHPPVNRQSASSALTPPGIGD